MTTSQHSLTKKQTVTTGVTYTRHIKACGETRPFAERILTDKHPATNRLPTTNQQLDARVYGIPAMRQPKPTIGSDRHDDLKLSHRWCHWSRFVFFGRCGQVFGGNVWLAGLFTVLIGFVLPAKTVRAEVTATEVQRAIDRGVGYLRKTQLETGGWREYNGQTGGLSALCTLAMLNAGVSREDPDIVRALRYLRTLEPTQTYSLSLQTLVYCHVGSAADIQRIRQNVMRLVRAQKPRGDQRSEGAWDYGNNRGSGDKSNSQFALLAIGAAADRGINIDSGVFRLAYGYWTASQTNEGGWGYRGQKESGSMTCAGVASLLIARARLNDSNAAGQTTKIQCCGPTTGDEDRVERGLEFLGKHFSVRGNPGSDADYFYYLYALERVGRLSGRRFIGGHDWYREGAEQLLSIQDSFQGSWGGSTPRDGNRNVSTSFALLFLGKGKRQVVVAGLELDRTNKINQRTPAGLRQLVHFVERDWKRELTWQSILASEAELTDLMQTPVLVISGDGPLTIDTEQSGKLREYIDQGGTILFDAAAGDGCGDANGFQESVRKLCGDWFPGSTLSRLPTDHPVWFAEHEVKPSTIGNDYWVYGVQACCRTAVFYSPRSLTCRWRYGDLLLRRGGRQTIAGQQADAGIRIGQNIIAYATGRELKDKLDRAQMIGGGTVPAPGRGAVELSVLEIGAGADQVPRAAPNAAELIRRLRPIPIRADQKTIAISEQALSTVPMVWIHGRTDFQLTAQQRDLLKSFIDRQGVIVGSAICGSKEFTAAFEREIVPLVESDFRPVPATHPMLTKQFGGFDLSTVAIRRPADTGRSVEIRKTMSPPIIQTAGSDTLTQIFYSPLDLSCALESPNSIQCPGYETADAAKIMANLLLYIQNH